jgi:hypothetical protein
MLDASTGAAAAASAEEVVKIYADKDGQTLASGVSAELNDVTGSTDKEIVLKYGTAPTKNQVYWLSLDGSARTPVYVLASAYSGGSSKTLSLNDDTTVTLGQYAPVNTDVDKKVTIAGDQNARKLADFTDLSSATQDEKDAIGWFISSGFANGGDSLDTFGYARTDYYRWEIAMPFYRIFSIVSDNIIDTSGGMPPKVYANFSDVANYNDQFSDSVANIARAGVLEDVVAFKPWDTSPTTYGAEQKVTWSDLLVMTYNAFNSPFSMLTSDGEDLATVIGDTATDATAKATAVKAALKSELSYDLDSVTDTAEVSKMDVVTYFYKVFGGTDQLTKQKTYPDATFASDTDSSNDNREAQLYPKTTFSTDTTVTGSAYVFDADTDATNGKGVALYVKDGAEVTLVNPYISTNSVSPDSLPGGSPLDYRFGINSAAITQGEDTILNIKSDNGALVLNAQGGSMAGGLYTTAGSSIRVTNGHLYTNGQHTSNITYNGTLHYEDSTVFGVGRSFSSDFWSGNIVYDKSLFYQTGSGGAYVIDESNSVYVKDTYMYGSGSYNVHGGGTVYYENSYVDSAGSYFAVMNNTSAMSDVGTVILDGSTFRTKADNLATVSKGEKAVMRLNNSTIRTNGASDSIIKMFNTTEVNGTLKDGDPDDLFKGGLELYVTGDTTFNGQNATLHVNVGYDYDLTVHTDSANDNLQIVNHPDLDKSGQGNIKIVKSDNSVTPVSTETAPTTVWGPDGGDMMGGGPGGGPGGDAPVVNTPKSVMGDMPILDSGVATISSDKATFTLKGVYTYDNAGNYTGVIPYSEGNDGLLDVGDTTASLTYGAAAKLINRLMRDSRVSGYDASIIGKSNEEAQAYAALQTVDVADKSSKIISGDPGATVTIQREAFENLLAAALHVTRTEFVDVGDYGNSLKADGAINIGEAYETILDLVLIARENADIVEGDNSFNKFLSIEGGSSWSPEVNSGFIFSSGLIGYGTISGIHGKGNKKYNLRTQEYDGLTIYYDALAGSANCTMPQDPRSFEMLYVEGGARLYPAYPAELVDKAESVRVYKGSGTTVNAGDPGTKNSDATAVYSNSEAYNIRGATIYSNASFGPVKTLTGQEIGTATFGVGDAVYATGDGEINLRNSSVKNDAGRAVTALGGAKVYVAGSDLISSSHGVCVLYGGVLEIEDTTVTSSRAALASDFGGGLMIADNVTATGTTAGGPGALADGMTFTYVKNSKLTGVADSAAATAGCGWLNIDNSTLVGNDKSILYSYVFGMLASNKSEFTVTNSELSGNSHGIYIQGNTIDLKLKKDTINFNNDNTGTEYLIKAENPTQPAPFYTRANVYIEDMDVTGDIYFNALVSKSGNQVLPCATGYTDTYLNVYIGPNASWSGSVVTSGNDGYVNLFRYNTGTGDYDAVPYTLDTALTVPYKDDGKKDDDKDDDKKDEDKKNEDKKDDTPALVNISTATVSKIADQPYSGAVKTPKPVVTIGAKTLAEGTDYTLSYGNNKNIGAATLTITGKGAYNGAKAVTFKIIPKKSAISSVKAGKGKLTVKWKVATKAQKIKGYQLRYRLKGAKMWRTKTISVKKTSYTIGKLKKGKTYQIQVRAYKKVSKTTYYGAWSATKSKKTKK